MIKVDNLCYSFPEKELYNNISFTLERGDHCAFIGTSGSGKSTLVNILLHPDQYLFDGKLEIDEHCRIGYVSQFSQEEQLKDLTVFEYIAEDFIQLQKQIDDLCLQMGSAEDLDAVFEEYQKVLDAFAAVDGDHYENHIIKGLNLANLTRHKDLPVKALSGGEFKLIQVIKEMLVAPDMMIMDEPDVFLDFDHLNALKSLINYHKGVLLIITHNRYLLNHCFNKILHLENKELQEYCGTYIEYNFDLLQKKIELQELAMADEEEIQRNARIIDRMRDSATMYIDAGRGKTLHARVKILERLEARRIKAPFVEIKEPHIQLTACEINPEINPLTVTGYRLEFDDILLEDVSFEIGPKDKVALIGANGTGKTTLLREIYQNQNPSIALADTTKIAFLSQLQGEMLTETNTLYDEFFDIGFKTYDQIKEYLQEYHFPEEILTQKIASLSGGEKNILQLAKISSCKSNLLLLDEPTSHLDTYSQIALEKAIANYEGAILMISHDFYTIVNSADYILILEDRTLRKMSMRKFRKNIYAKHFNKDYLELEQKKKELETKIEQSLLNKDFEKAKEISLELEEIISRMQ